MFKIAFSKKLFASLLSMAVAIVGSVQDADAAVIVATGGYIVTDVHTFPSVELNFLTGAGSPTRNAYFVFDLTTEAAFGAGSFTSGTLTWTKLGLAFGPAGTATVSLFDVSTDLTALSTTVGILPGAFADLGSGAVYGSSTFAVPVSALDSRAFTLTSAALTALDSARTAPPNLIAFGASITASDVDALIFEGTASVSLALTFTPAAVPEPTTLSGLALIAGVCGIYANRRRNRSQTLSAG